MFLHRTHYNGFQLDETLTWRKNILDLVFTTNDTLIHNVEVTDDECCSVYFDHKALIWDLVLRYKPKPPIQRVVYDYFRADIEGLLRNAHLLDIVQEESHDVNTVWMEWKYTFLSVVYSFIPKHTTKRLSTLPYITRDLLHAIKGQWQQKSFIVLNERTCITVY